MSDPSAQFVWGHININVRRLERSIEFYEQLGFEIFIPGIPYLGLTSDADAAAIPADGALALGLPPEARGRACIMQLGSGFPKIDLTELAVSGQKRPLANGDLGLVRLCLASRDLESDYERLRDLGVEFLSAPQRAKDGLADIVTCVDPDGTLIELLQIHLEKWPRPLTGE